MKEEICKCGHSKYSHKYSWGGTCMNKDDGGYFLCACLKFKQLIVKRK